MGQLILNGGSPVLSPHTLSNCFRGSSANCAFGMGFWNNAMAGDSSGRELDVEDMLEPKWNRQNWRNVCICQAAPPDLVASVGSGYQRLFVIPSLHMIIVRQGQFGRFSDGEFLRLALGRHKRLGKKAPRITQMDTNGKDFIRVIRVIRGRTFQLGDLFHSLQELDEAWRR